MSDQTSVTKSNDAGLHPSGSAKLMSNYEKQPTHTCSSSPPVEMETKSASSECNSTNAKHESVQYPDKKAKSVRIPNRCILRSVILVGTLVVAMLAYRYQ